MDYCNFKKELYKVLTESEETSGKTVRILERDGGAADLETIRLIGLCDVGWYEDNRTVAFEDRLCILEDHCGEIHLLYWRLKYLYERFAREGWQGILPEILIEFPFRESRMILQPLNRIFHRSEVENSIHWRFGEIALVLRALISGEREDCVTMKYSRAMDGKCNLPDEILLTNALLHSLATFPPKLYPVWDREAEATEYRLATEGGMNSAVALFYPGVREEMAEMFAGDYYVGFRGMQEAVLCPVSNMGPGRLKKSISQTNVMIDPGEVLTDRVYRYCRDRQRLIEV